MGSAIADDYVRKTYVGSKVLNLGDIPPNNATWLLGRGFYMGVVDGTTKYGDIIDVGPVDYYEKPPKVSSDSKRKALSIRDWMGEFQKTHIEPGRARIHKGDDQKRICQLFLPPEGGRSDQDHRFSTTPTRLAAQASRWTMPDTIGSLASLTRVRPPASS